MDWLRAAFVGTFATFALGIIYGLYKQEKKELENIRNAQLRGESKKREKEEEEEKNPQTPPPSTPPVQYTSNYNTTPIEPEICLFRPLSKVEHERNIFILDYGSSTLKAGCPNELPSIMEDTIIGKTKEGKKRVLFGNKISKRQANDLELKVPIQAGKIMDYETTKVIWKHCLSKGANNYGVEISDLSVVVATSDCNRRELCEILFEEYHVEGILFQSQEVLGILDQRRWSGLSVHLGGGYSSIVPVYMGCQLPHHSERFATSGASVTSYVSQHIEWRSQRETLGQVDDRTKLKLAKAMKEDFSSVPDISGLLPPLDYGKGIETTSFIDKAIVTKLLNDSTKACGQLYFSSDRNGKPLHQMIAEVIQSCDPSLHSLLWDNIVLHGGSAAMPGLSLRLHQELEQITNHQAFNIRTKEKPHLAAWRGACNLSTVSDFSDQFLPFDMYHEFGPEICSAYFLG